MKNNDFAKIIILILLNSSVYTQEIKQIVNNPMPKHQFPEIQSIDFPEIQSIDSPPIQIQESDTNIRLSKANKVIQSIDIPVPSAKKIIEQMSNTTSNIKIPVPNMEKVAKKVNKEFSIPKPQIPNKAKTIVGNSALDGFNLGITADVGFITGETFSNVPLGFSLTIGTPYGFDLGPFDFSVSAIFGGYSGSYDSAKIAYVKVEKSDTSQNSTSSEISFLIESNKLNIHISKTNVLINTNNFFHHDLEIQTKIIEIIYKFLRPKKEFLRYKRIVNSLNASYKS